MERLPKISRDSAYKKRGGTAKWIILSCGICKEDLSLYQKDGQGNLYRLYLDRLTSTSGERPFKYLGRVAVGNLECFACEETIAVPMIYQKDERPRVALRLVGAGVNQNNLSGKNIAQIPELDITQTMGSIISKTTTEENHYD